MPKIADVLRDHLPHLHSLCGGEPHRHTDELTYQNDSLVWPAEILEQVCTERRFEVLRACDESVSALDVNALQVAPERDDLLQIRASCPANGEVVEHAQEVWHRTIELDLRSIRAAAVRDPNVSALGENAKPRTVLTVAKGQREEGDAENRLLELTFGGYPGTELERQNAVLVSVSSAESGVGGRIEIEPGDGLLLGPPGAPDALARGCRAAPLAPATSGG